MLGSGQNKMFRGKAVFDGFTFPDKLPAGMTVFKSNIFIGFWGFAEPEPGDRPVLLPEND